MIKKFIYFVLFPTTLSIAACVSCKQNNAFTPTTRNIIFSGYEWESRSAAKPTGPGNNYFAGNEDAVWVDAEERLHLTIRQRDSVWYSSEVRLTSKLGYGKYIFQIASNLNNIDKNAVIGLFTWSDNESQNHREIDIEFSKWGNDKSSNNAQYVVQPSTTKENIEQFSVETFQERSTHLFSWNKKSLEFISVNSFVTSVNMAAAVAMYSWTYSGSSIPTSEDERVHINFWLNNAAPPANEQELIIQKFVFIPEPSL